jgi:hypothetical protein
MASSHTVNWATVDPEILAGHKLLAILAIKASGASLTEALHLLNERYELLRQTRPNDFSVPPDRYWDGFYS